MLERGQECAQAQAHARGLEGAERLGTSLGLLISLLKSKQVHPCCYCARPDSETLNSKPMPFNLAVAPLELQGLVNCLDANMLDPQDLRRGGLVGKCRAR